LDQLSDDDVQTQTTTFVNTKHRPVAQLVTCAEVRNTLCTRLYWVTYAQKLSQKN